MNSKLIKEVVDDYEEPEIINHLNTPFSRANTYRDEVTIEESIDKIIKIALHDLDETNRENLCQIKNSDTYIFPDIHGRLDLFVQNLFVANFIDYDLLRGYQAFMTIENDKIYQVYSKKNGLDKGYCKRLEFKSWDMSLIAKLPNKDIEFLENIEKKLEKKPEIKLGKNTNKKDGNFLTRYFGF